MDRETDEEERKQKTHMACIRRGKNDKYKSTLYISLLRYAKLHCSQEIL
jgi:hypothetical protein